MCGITAQPPNRKINKTALGSTESVEWEYFKSTKKIIEKLKSKGVKIWSIEQVENAKKLHEIEEIDKGIEHAVIFGNEIKANYFAERFEFELHQEKLLACGGGGGGGGGGSSPAAKKAKKEKQTKAKISFKKRQLSKAAAAGEPTAELSAEIEA